MYTSNQLWPHGNGLDEFDNVPLSKAGFSAGFLDPRTYMYTPTTQEASFYMLCSWLALSVSF